MDELFDGIQAFVYTAEAASFRRAAERLGVSPAAVSRALGRLEEDLGVTLLHRTTRRVALSAEGELYLARCREALAAMEDGRRAPPRCGRSCAGAWSSPCRQCWGGR
ncbi:MAG: LysR family transcriptional regulator [Alphaproteobacteria bacterium]|nr:LysR family transcriptional regulator [Alphaproteobacteria bacterium]